MRAERFALRQHLHAGALVTTRFFVLKALVLTNEPTLMDALLKLELDAASAPGFGDFLFHLVVASTC